MTAAILQVGFLVAAVFLVVAWAERPRRRYHDDNCDICARRSR